MSRQKGDICRDAPERALISLEDTIIDVHGCMSGRFGGGLIS